MNIEISEFAQRELEDAVFFYELQESGLGLKFREDVLKAIDRILMYPKGWPIERDEVRKCFVRKFPYKILYSLQRENIIILAISHQHRRPGYWIEGGS